MRRIIQTEITGGSGTVGYVSNSIAGKVNIKTLGTLGTGAYSTLTL